MIKIDGSSLSIEDVVRVAREGVGAELAESARQPVERSRELVEQVLRAGKVVYGISTGVGELAHEVISADQAEAMQRNLLRSHAVGVGEPLGEDVVRAIMLLRANALAKGYSGVRAELITFLLEMINRDVLPMIPCRGSVGASGDLAPLAHLALVIMGEGECMRGGARVAAEEALREAGLAPMTLQPKEGLALINGTQLMAALGCLVVKDAEILLKNALIAGAMSFEGGEHAPPAGRQRDHRLSQELPEGAGRLHAAVHSAGVRGGS